MDYASWLHLKDDLLYIRSAVTTGLIEPFIDQDLQYQLEKISFHARKALEELEKSHVWSDERQ